jgi:hypothetical protein
MHRWRGPVAGFHEVTRQLSCAATQFEDGTSGLTDGLEKRAHTGSTNVGVEIEAQVVHEGQIFAIVRLELRCRITHGVV